MNKDLSNLLLTMGKALATKNPVKSMSKETGLHEATCAIYLMNAENIRKSIGKVKSLKFTSQN